MIPWWQLHPIIAPLPKGFMDDDRSHAEAKEWMEAATRKIEKLTEDLTGSDIVPAILRPGMYSGEQGDRTHERWVADSVAAYVNQKRNPRLR